MKNFLAAQRALYGVDWGFIRFYGPAKTCKRYM
jgi:hypothetical protein